MWVRKFILLVVILVLSCSITYAQEIPTPNDSTHINRKPRNYSDQNKFTRFVYWLFYKPVELDFSKIKKNKSRIQKPYYTLEGKIIRNITIETLDPFGNSVGDTIGTSQGLISRVGNRFHLQTRENIIRNLLLISKNQPFDELLATESERLVRSMNYVTEVSFYVAEVPNQPDSVDILIRELDKWSLLPGGSISDTRLNFNLTETNLLGLGHEFYNKIVWNRSTQKYVYRTKYFVPNIGNSFINSTLQYGTDEYGNSLNSVAFSRPFFSPITKWAAGVNFSQHQHANTIWSVNNMYFKYYQQDYWVGNAIRMFNDNPANKHTTNFISNASFLHTHFIEKPLETIDTLKFYADEHFYLASLGISSRLYVKDEYIFKFGETEDVPVGKVFSLTVGYQKKNNIGRIYMGGRISWGDYYRWGYLCSNFEYGTFLRDSKAEQGIFSADIIYFTNLIEIGRWKLRQFLKPQLTIGLNRIDYKSLTLNDEYGLRGFSSPTLSGNSRILLTSQTQLYAPWNFIGFQFGPYITCSLGMLGDEENGFRDSNVYAHIGLGILIKNKNLVMNTFQIAISFYPIIPGEGSNIFKVNSFQTTDLGFRDFEIGKTTTPLYR